MEDVDCCVDIPVVGSPAGGTHPMPYTKVFDLFVAVPAARASLTGRIEAVYEDDLLSIPVGLVLKLPTDLTEGCVRYRLRKMVVFDHALSVQVFQADGIVAAYQIQQYLLFVDNGIPEVLPFLSHDSNNTYYA